jgi:predicted GNAT superfamily acetyltransferase
MTTIHPITPATLAPVLELNRRHENELSPLTASRLGQLVDAAYFARVAGGADAFIIAFDETNDYDSPNFIWFRERYPRFAYVDRIAVADHARGRGLARRLYEALFAKAAADGHGVIACEVNLDPPNPASDGFHAALGFREVGAGGYGARTVRYYVKDI